MFSSATNTASSTLYFIFAHLASSNIMEILHHLCFLLAAILSSCVPTGTLLMRLSRKLQLFSDSLNILPKGIDFCTKNQILHNSITKRFLCSFERVLQIKNKMSLKLSACIGRGCISFHMFAFCMLLTDCSQAKIEWQASILYIAFTHSTSRCV